MTPGGMSAEQPVGRGRVDDERLEISIVDADDRRAALYCSRELRLVSNLDDHLERQLARGVDHLEQGIRRERARDQQRRRCAERFGFDQLNRVDVKILFEHGNADRVANGDQVGHRPAEVSRLGEDRDRRGAAALIRASLIRRPKGPG